ncbi:MAG: tRNA pseudouridine(38-40) synthase TruA [Chitinophagaceae bacterium]
MSRYFIEVAYKGTNYSGFQVQENANTIQAEIEKAFAVLHRTNVVLTGSSRTDAGVHALQNYFHFDFEPDVNKAFLYKMNAILPQDIVIKAIHPMPEGAHSRFDATSRSYIYRIHQFKNPFLQDSSFYYPFKLNLQLLQEAAALVKTKTNFFAFCKTNTQVNNFNCVIKRSEWEVEGSELTYTIEGNRFLRGMVRLLVGSLLKVGREKLTLLDLESLFQSNTKSGYAAPAQGLFLEGVHYPENYFPATDVHFTRF